MPLNLKVIRKWVDAQESQIAAAERLQMHRVNLSRIMAGDERATNVKLDRLEHIADVIGVEPAELIRRAKIV